MPRKMRFRKTMEKSSVLIWEQLTRMYTPGWDYIIEGEKS